MGQWALDNDIWVIADEIYQNLVYDMGVDHALSIAEAVPGLKDKCILVNGVAKTYAMTGWRLGWMVGPADAIKAAANLQSHLSSNVSNISQLAALAALAARRGEPPVAPGGARMYAVALPGLLGAILLSWSGHAASGSDPVLCTAIDVIHGWATAAWLGGLVMLAALALPVMRRLAPTTRVELGAAAIVRL